MNPEKPSREEIEAKLTALLLGELPAEEAQLLRWAISQDAELKKLHDRLQFTIGLVREVAAHPAETIPAQTAPLKLSDEKREKLLAHFKTVQSIVFLPPLPKRREISPLLAMAAAVALIAVLAAMLLPALSKAKSKAQRITMLSGKAQASFEQSDIGNIDQNSPATTAPAANQFALTPHALPGGNVAGGVVNNTPSQRQVAVDQRVTSLEARIQNDKPTANGGDAWKKQTTIVLPASGAADDDLAVASPAQSDFFDSGSRNSEPNALLAGNANQNYFGLTPAQTPAQNNFFGSYLDTKLADNGQTAAANRRSGGSGGGGQSQEWLGKMETAADSARQTQMRATDIKTTVNGFAFNTGNGDDVGAPNYTFGNKANGINFNISQSPALAAAPTVAPPAADKVSILGDVARMDSLFKSGSANQGGEIATITAASVSGDLGVVKDGNGNLTFSDGSVQQGSVDQFRGAIRHGNGSITPLPGRRVFAETSPDSASIVAPPTAESSPAPITRALPVLTSTAGTQVSPNAPVPNSNGPDSPQVYTRNFKIDQNTFYQGLQNVPTFTFGSANNNSNGGLRLVTAPSTTENISVAAQTFFKTLGVDLTTPGKSIFFNDRLGMLFVRGTEEDLDTIDRAVQTLKATAPAAIDAPLPKTPSPAPVPTPEILTRENAFSTFSLNVSDVSFKLAAASLEKGQLPDAASIRSEEFINAFNYRDPEPLAGVPVAFVAERARDPFTHNRDLLRFSIKTAAAGREAGRPLNIVLLLDNSGSMERADRVAIIHEALKVLASQLQPQDTLSIVTFARTARLWVDGAHGDEAGTAVNKVSDLVPEGGTNLEEAMNLAYATARRHYLANGGNRVVLLTDGAANLGNVNPEALKQKVESFRKQGIALDCFGIGWEGYNDDLLEVLSSNGDGRYGFINTPEAATTEFAAQLTGALHVAAEDVKVQVEFNPQRVISYRQIGYAKHQLTKEQFRDNTVATAPMAAREAGNALYTVEINPQGEGPVATVRVRFRIPGTPDVSEHEWQVPFDGTAPALEKSSPALRLAATASAFSEWLASSPYAQEVTTDQLLNYLNGVPAIYDADARPKQLETMIREAKSLSGK